jgi:hypothetical protein
LFFWFWSWLFLFLNFVSCPLCKLSIVFNLILW